MLSVWFWIWLAIAIGFAILEMLSLSFYLIPFSFGALLALIAYFFSAPIWLQVVLFALGTILSFIFVRPFARSLAKRAPKQESAIDRVIGKQARITKAITSEEPIGRAIVLGEVWLAVAQDSSESFKVDQEVSVVGVDGTKLVIKEL